MLIPSATSFVMSALISRPMTVITKMTAMIMFVVFMIKIKFIFRAKSDKAERKRDKKFEVSLLVLL